MALFQRKWAAALLVLLFVLGYNGVTGWLESRGEALLPEAGAAATSPEPSAAEGTAPSEPAGVQAPAPDPPPAELWVHVCGEVAQPGVYPVPAGGRVNDAVRAAGGFTLKADTTSVNLAETVADGQQILIWAKGAAGSPGAGAAKPASAAAGKGGAGGGNPLPVSINQGSREALMLLDGIGEKTAQKIIDYRETHGGFKTLEELKNVPGIGEKKYDQVKNDIRL